MKDDDSGESIAAVALRLLRPPLLAAIPVVVACTCYALWHPGTATMLAFVTPYATTTVVFDETGWMGEFRAGGGGEWKIDWQSYEAEPIIDMLEQIPIPKLKQDGVSVWRTSAVGLYVASILTINQYFLTVRHWFVILVCGCTFLLVAWYSVRRRMYAKNEQRPQRTVRA